MSGFFKVDCEDFDELMANASMAGLFHVRCILNRYSWRQFDHTKTKRIRINGVAVELGPGELVYNETRLAADHAYKRTTFRSHVHRLIEMGEVEIRNVTPSIRILRLLRTYKYNKLFGPIPCYPDSILTVDGHQMDTGLTGEADIRLPDNELHDPYTDRLIDCATVTQGVQDRHLREEEREVGSLESGSPSFTEDEIQRTADEIRATRPEVQPEMARIMALQRLAKQQSAPWRMHPEDQDCSRKEEGGD